MLDLELPADADLGFWRSEVDRAKRVRQLHEPDWQTNLDYYAGKNPDAAKAEGDFVNVNTDFYQVEQKMAQLFFETPELQLTAAEPMKGREAAVSVHRTLLNELLGADNADVLRTAQKCMKDCLCPSGCGPSVIGYDPTVLDAPAPPQLGDVLGLKQTVPVVIHEHWYWDRFSPKKLLIPADFHDTDYDAAPWLGMEFRMPMALAKRQFELPETFTGTKTKDEQVFEGETASLEESGAAYVDGQAVWYRAAVYDATAYHPELFRELVLIDGLEEPARHRDSPHQTIGPDGRMSADSMIGNPIHPLTLRDLPDSAYVPSDCQMTRPLVRELCKFRTQMVKERDVNRPIFGYDIDAVPPETLEKIRTATTGGMIGFEGGRLAAGKESLFTQLAQGQSPRQTYLANDYIQRDISKTLALDDNQLGIRSSSQRTATEVSEIGQAANVRLDAERRRVLDWYLKGVAKFSALVVRYMEPGRAVAIIGPDGAQAWAQWDKQAIDGRLAFSARPDSQIRVDAAQDRRLYLQLYQMVANDPNVVRIELLRKLFEKYGFDSQRLVVAELPDKGPEPPKIAFSIKGEELNPLMPQFPIVMEILRLGGFAIDPNTVGKAQLQAKMTSLGMNATANDGGGEPTPQPVPHGGAARQVEPLGKHQLDETGERSGPKVM